MPVCAYSVPSICISVTWWLALIIVFQHSMLLKLEQDLIKYINKHSGTSLHKSGTRCTDFQRVHKDLYYYSQSNIWPCFFAISTYIIYKSQIWTLTACPHINFFLWSHNGVRGSSLRIQRGFWCQRFEMSCLYLHPSQVWRSIAATLQPQFICSGTENQHLLCSAGSLCNHGSSWTKPSTPLPPTPPSH